MKLRILMMLLTFAFAATTAQAKKVKYKECGVKFNVPKKLKAAKDDGVWTFETKDDDLGIIALCVPGENIEAAGNQLEAMVKQIVPDFKENPKDEGEGEINGMKAFTAGGAGHVDDDGKKEAVELGLLMLVTPKGKVVILIGIVKADRVKKYDPVLEKFIGSIKAMK